MFKDMAADTYLASAGIADDWPYGRGCWQSDDKQCIVWFGEEDQLRIMCMKRGTKLNEVFDRLKTMLDTIESIDGITFATSSKYGYVTSCPSNLGTGMRASVHVEICVEINRCVGCWLCRAARNRHRHAIEQPSHRWRGGRREEHERAVKV